MGISGHNNKAGYSQSDAERAVLKMKRRGLATAKAYRCKECGKFHVTSGGLGLWIDPWGKFR